MHARKDLFVKVSLTFAYLSVVLDNLLCIMSCQAYAQLIVSNKPRLTRMCRIAAKQSSKQNAITLHWIRSTYLYMQWLTDIRYTLWECTLEYVASKASSASVLQNQHRQNDT